MVDYWHYKSVLYWSNVVKGKQTFCLNPMFFKTAEAVMGREELVEAVWNRIPPDVLHELQTVSETYRHRLDFNEPQEEILLVLWNANATRGVVREILLERALAWLSGAEREGVGVGPDPWPGAAVEAALCVDRGLLVPPGPCEDKEELRSFLNLAVGDAPAGEFETVTKKEDEDVRTGDEEHA